MSRRFIIVASIVLLSLSFLACLGAVAVSPGSQGMVSASDRPGYELGLAVGSGIGVGLAVWGYLAATLFTGAFIWSVGKEIFRGKAV